MSILDLNKTKNTPAVNAKINGDTAVISVVGNSFPENAKKFYADLITWLNENESVLKSAEFNCDFHYMASSSLICFLDVLRTADKVVGKENCKVNWKYEEDDDDILKIGQNFGKILNVEINLIAY